MAAKTLTEEELQRKVILSDEDVDADFENDDDVDVNMVGENDDAYAANNQLLDGVVASQELYNEDAEGEDEEQEDELQGGSEIDNLEDDGGDEDAERESDEEVDGLRFLSRGGDAEEDDAEGDEDGSAEEEEDDNVEGVGAVKIQPGLENDDDDEESEASVDENISDESSDAESEAEMEWEAAAEADEDDGLPKNDNPSRCIFCQNDEADDPSEEFEEYLACAVCGDNAHQQCARENHKIDEDQDIKTWRCPDCIGNSLEPESTMHSGGEVNAALLEKYSSAPKIARDLLPPQKGTIKPGSHSVFNNLIVDDDPMDGSRTLRKRKTSSAEAEDLTSLRIKRRKKLSSGSVHAVSVENKRERTEEEVLGEEEAIDNDDADEEEGDATSRPSRMLRIKLTTPQPSAIVTKRKRKSIQIRIKVNPIELTKILSLPPLPRKRDKRFRSGFATVVRPRPTVAAVPTYQPSYAQTFYSFHDKENDDVKSKPYGGILTSEESKTDKRLPLGEDRKSFDDSRQKAEDLRKEKQLAALAEAEPIKKPRKVSGPASQIECINFGGVEIDTWYAAPYPEEYSRNRVLYICEFCLKYMSSDYVAWRHKMKCGIKHPPGDEIYREGSIGVFEVDGRKNPVYCQNLCLLAKLFLGSKTLYYDVEPFLFYVMTEHDINGCHFVGYFSKEKRPSSQNNVSCILTLPIHQRKGYGNLLIDFSYLLTRVEQKSGSPEKPLSDMGLVSYRNYWRLILSYQLRHQKEQLSIIDISERTGMTADDIVSGLEGLRALVRDPVTGTYAIRLDHEFFDQYIEKWESKNYVKLNEKSLVWTPFVMGRQQASMIEHNPMSTVAPREEDEDVAPDEIGQSVVVNGTSTSRPALTNGITTLLEAEEISVTKEENGDSQMVDVPSEPIADETLHMGSPKGTPRSPQHLTALPSEILLTNGHADPPVMALDEHEMIPPSRFEIYPPIKDTRRPRPTLNRNPTSLGRPRGGMTGRKSATRRRTTGGSVRRTLGRPRGSGRRRAGGTGRGPGRWPKGTKKSDFGNADSGPGLPPKLVLKRKKTDDEEDLFEDSVAILEKDEAEDEDAILYETPGRKRPNVSRPRRSTGIGKGKTLLLSDDEDEAVDDGEFVTGDIGAEEDDDDEEEE